MKVYVIAVIVVLVITNLITGSVDGGAYARIVEILSGGFLVGMFAMYIAMHVYKY